MTVKMQKRNLGIDIFRIMCCIGVLDYHMVDDVLGIGGYTGYVLYYLASFCVPGFFLLSGYLFGEKDNLDALYIENKVTNILVKLFGWIVFWITVHFIRTGELYGLWDNFMAGVVSGGILPVSWFLFTYCFLLIVGYPLYYLNKKHSYVFCGLVVLWMAALALGYGKNIMYLKTQSLWIYLYLGYFCVGILLSNFADKILGGGENPKLQIIILLIINIGSMVVYAYNVVVSEEFRLPNTYYREWFYILWLVSLFLIVLQIRLRNEEIQRIILKLASNTFVVYLGHLPILLYITEIFPLKSVEMAIVYIFIFFIGLEIMAELFRKLPLLRKLV